MEIWLDTADFKLIEEAKQMGILHGVTTNPSIIAHSQLGIEELLGKILSSQNGPIAAQVTAHNAMKMIEQGEALYRFSNRIIVKVPVTAEGVKAIHSLTQKKIPVMATAVFDTGQVLLAARAGATYIAPYFSIICDLDASGIDQFHEMFKLLKRYNYSSKLLGASLSSTEQLKQCLEMGIDAATLGDEVFLAFIKDHEETVKKLGHFAKDWQTVKESKTLLL